MYGNEVQTNSACPQRQQGERVAQAVQIQAQSLLGTPCDLLICTSAEPYSIQESRLRDKSLHEE